MTEPSDKKIAIKHLQELRNVGEATAEKLYAIGIKTPEQMMRSDPQEVYQKLKESAGGKLDRCVLYQMQGAVLDIPWWECKNLKTSTVRNKPERDYGQGIETGTKG